MIDWPKLRAHALDIDGWMEDVELDWLHEFAASRSGLVVEVGAYRGRSSIAIASGLPDDAHFLVVDTFDDRGTVTEGERDWSTSLANLRRHEANLRRVGLHVGGYELADSVSAAARWEGVDWLFLDASHDEASVRADLSAWLPKMRSGGVISGHDYDTTWPGVIAAVDDLLGRVKRAPGSLWWKEIR